MSKFKEVMKSAIKELKEAGNYPDDFNGSLFDALYGNDEMENAEQAYAVLVVSGVIENDANSSPEDPLDLDTLRKAPHVNQTDYVGIAKKPETIEKWGMYEADGDLITKYEDKNYYNVFDTEEQAKQVLEGFQQLNPKTVLKIINVYTLDQGDTYFDDPSYR